MNNNTVATSLIVGMLVGGLCNNAAASDKRGDQAVQIQDQHTLDSDMLKCLSVNNAESIDEYTKRVFIQSRFTSIRQGAFMDLELFSKYYFQYVVPCNAMKEFLRSYCDIDDRIEDGELSIESVVVDEQADKTPEWRWGWPDDGTLIIPGELKSVAEGMFAGRRDLKSATIPDSVTHVGDLAFKHCDSCKFTIGANVESFGQEAFFGCRALKGPLILEKVMEIKTSAFTCSGLTHVEILGNVQEIGRGAFHMCSYLQKVVIGGGVKIVGKNAFSRCTNLSDLTITDGVEVIEYRAFDGCERLDTVTIPDSVTEIGEDAFHGCNLKKVYVYNTRTRDLVIDSGVDHTIVEIIKDPTDCISSKRSNVQHL